MLHDSGVSHNFVLSFNMRTTYPTKTTKTTQTVTPKKYCKNSLFNYMLNNGAAYMTNIYINKGVNRYADWCT
ncbi:hypothetical protein AHAT_21770 [Agarivorans sp. Toyoura001]|nr:hypothetical protein AHAT_21770 [Agarivorans sp. Toyoura001]